MGTVFKKTFTKPLPTGAETFVRKGQRFARWKDSKGKTRTAPLTVGADGTDRITVESGTYVAKYRDGSGIVHETATGGRDADAARAVLGDLERRSELVKAGVLTAADDAVADHQLTPLAGHLAAYIAHQNAKALNAVRVRNSVSRLNRLAAECGFVRLADLAAEPLERWLVSQKAEGMGPGTRNEYRTELVGFANWGIRTGRLTSNPFVTVAKALAKADRRCGLTWPPTCGRGSMTATGRLSPKPTGKQSPSGGHPVGTQRRKQQTRSCSQFPPGWCGFSTATSKPLASPRKTTGAGRLTFTPCGGHSPRCYQRRAWHRERLKPRCGIRPST